MPKATPQSEKSAKKAAKTAIKAVAKPIAKQPRVKSPATKPVAKLPDAKAVKAAPKTKTAHYFYANGKRKTAVSSVRLFPNGKGAITINGRTFENYFPLQLDQDKVLSPFRVTNTLSQFDVSAMLQGGGVHSQAEALRHGIAKALLAYSVDLRGNLKPLGFLTRDSRIKERKKYGLKRARRAPQWQKR